MNPRVSVVLSARDAERYVGGAVESVLAQTFRDLELIVVDDGSTDGTPRVLGAFREPRLTVVSQPNAGLTASLNRAVGLGRGALIARLDADDIAAPDRLERQVAFLDAHPEVGLLGTGCREVTESGALVRIVTPPAEDRAIRGALIRRNPFVHSSVMMRRAPLLAVGGYDERLPVAQDYDLWMRMSRVTRLANLPAPLVTRRLVAGSVSLAREAARLRGEARVRWRAVASGAYPWWCAVFALRPALALALPRPVRRALRRARLHDGMGSPRA